MNDDIAPGGKLLSPSCFRVFAVLRGLSGWKSLIPGGVKLAVAVCIFLLATSHLCLGERRTLVKT